MENLKTKFEFQFLAMRSIKSEQALLLTTVSSLKYKCVFVFISKGWVQSIGFIYTTTS